MKEKKYLNMSKMVWSSLDDELATVVATGLIEAIVTATDSNSLLWQDLSKFLGDKSKSHALVWKNFGQE